MNINPLAFKRGAVIFLIFVAVNWFIHVLIMHTYLYQFQQNFNHINKQFNQNQALILQRIIESKQDADQWRKAFEKKQNEFHAAVDQGLRENLNFIHQSQEKMAEQQKIFDKQLAEMPDKMWEAHKSFGERAFARFAEDSKRIHAFASKQVGFEIAKDEAKTKTLQIHLQKEADKKTK